MESFIEMSKARPLETEEEKARKEYEARLDKVVRAVQSELLTYKELLASGDFEDKEDEDVGAGEKRKQAIQAKISSGMNRAETMKKVLDSGESIPSIQEEIQVEYVYKNPQTGVIETQETITLNIEEKLESFIDFYEKLGLPIPQNFEDEIKDIWQRNAENIQGAIEEGGFDDILIIPGNIPLAELAEKMKMGNGYYFYQMQEDFSDAKSVGVDKSRIILFHKATLPEVQKKTGLDVHLGITGGDAEKLIEKNPDDYLCTLEDFLIFERKGFEDTGKHLSDYTENSAQWLPRTKVGSRFVGSYLNSSDGKLGVSANDADGSDDYLGCRPSRYFM